MFAENFTGDGEAERKVNKGILHEWHVQHGEQLALFVKLLGPVVAFSLKCRESLTVLKAVKSILQ